jgi:hypothetical protein
MLTTLGDLNANVDDPSRRWMWTVLVVVVVVEWRQEALIDM